MLLRGLLTVAFALLAVEVAYAQQVIINPHDLPPLLVPPTGGPNPPLPLAPPGPTGEYDHNLLYIPEGAPPEELQPPETCRPLGRWWVDPSVALVTLPTSPAPGAVRLRVPDGMGGSIPGPILPVGGKSTGDFQAGFGLTIGRYIGDAHTNGIDASMFNLGPAERTSEGFAPGMLVAFPHGDTTSAPQVFLLQSPMNGILGSTFPTTMGTWFIGADVNYRHTLFCGPNARLDALVGYRFAYLQDEIYIGDVSNDGKDDYKRNRAAISNQFHGGQIGLAGEYRLNAWYVTGAAKMGFGAVTTDSSATGLFVGAEGVSGSGFSRLLALTETSRSRFAVLPTLNMTLGRQVGEHLRIYAGYSFQYLNRVTRIGDVLDANATTVPQTDFWASSLNLGMEFRY
jgi:Putative beta barrel porin-7 (BBP7)